MFSSLIIYVQGWRNKPFSGSTQFCIIICNQLSIEEIVMAINCIQITHALLDTVILLAYQEVQPVPPVLIWGLKVSTVMTHVCTLIH